MIHYIITANMFESLSTCELLLKCMVCLLLFLGWREGSGMWSDPRFRNRRVEHAQRSPYQVRELFSQFTRGMRFTLPVYSDFFTVNPGQLMNLDCQDLLYMVTPLTDLLWICFPVFFEIISLLFLVNKICS